jgi:twinkle protein
MSAQFIKGKARALPERDLTEKTVRRYSYWTGEVPVDQKGVAPGLRGQEVQIANFFDEDGKTLIGQKLRASDKSFAIIGDVSKGLFGRHCCKAGGKLLVVTEGEIDALSYAEARDGWPAVSLPNGVTSARKALEANIAYLESFDKVVLAFDNDKQGRKAIEDCKGVLSPGKMYVHALPENYKDMNEALQAGDMKAIMQAVFNAEQVRPDGIVHISDFLEEALEKVTVGLPWFLPKLTYWTFGRRWGETYGIGGPTGGGKTDFISEQITYDTLTLKEKVGVLMLEQKPAETAKRVAGKFDNVTYHIPIREGEPETFTQEDLRKRLLSLEEHMSFYDSFGETDWNVIKTVIRHMHMAEGIRIFYLDHLTAMIDTHDENGSAGQIMKEMAGLANELMIIIHYVSHLATPTGTPHEEGGRVMVRHFRGSRAIGYWSHIIIGLERDQQAEDPMERHKTTVRILKERLTGQGTGVTLETMYQSRTGRIVPYEEADTTGFDALSDQDEEDF